MIFKCFDITCLCFNNNGSLWLVLATCHFVLKNGFWQVKVQKSKLYQNWTTFSPDSINEPSVSNFSFHARWELKTLKFNSITDRRVLINIRFSTPELSVSFQNIKNRKTWQAADNVLAWLTVLSEDNRNDTRNFLTLYEIIQFLKRFYIIFRYKGQL